MARTKHFARETYLGLSEYDKFISNPSIEVLYQEVGFEGELSCRPAFVRVAKIEIIF